MLVLGIDDDSETEDLIYVYEDGAQPIWPGLKVIDEWGRTPELNVEENWDDGSSASTPYAIEKQSDGTYLLAVLNSFSYNRKEQGEVVTDTGQDWAIYTLNVSESDDSARAIIFSWENTSYVENVSSVEEVFNQDLNEDGVIGNNYTVANLTYVETDGDLAESPGINTLTHLMYNPFDDSLFITTQSKEVLPITDEGGYGVSLNNDHIYKSPDGATYEFKEQPFAIEPESLNSEEIAYNLVVREEYKRSKNGVEETDIGWIIYPVSQSGVIDWENSAWTPSIISYEELFNQDLNGDNGIGLTNITLPVVDTDKSGLEPDFGNIDHLFLDTSKALYILPSGSSTYIPITDSYGGAPSFDWSDNWGNNSVSSSSIAVESQTDGSFILAVKRIEKFNNETPRTNWELFPVNPEGILDWENGEWIETIDLKESLFRQDLNGDGVLGFNIASLNLVNVGQADSNGVLLQRSSNGGLYIKIDSNTLLPVTDEWGSSVSINYDTNNYSESPVAIHQVNVDGVISYVLAMKTIFKHSGTEETNWNLVPIDDAGVIYWNNQIHSQSIAAFERDFGWDLNGDSVTGINHARNVSVITDTINQKLERSLEGVIYILDGDRRIALTDIDGGLPDLEWSYEWASGTDSGSVFAVARQDSDTPDAVSYTHLTLPTKA